MPGEGNRKDKESEADACLMCLRNSESGVGEGKCSEGMSLEGCRLEHVGLYGQL